MINIGFCLTKMEKRFKAKKPKAQGSRFLKYLSGYRVLYLDLNLNTAGEFEFHQGVDRLGSRTVDVDQALVV